LGFRATPANGASALQDARCAYEAFGFNDARDGAAQKSLLVGFETRLSVGFAKDNDAWRTALIEADKKISRGSAVLRLPNAKLTGANGRRVAGFCCAIGQLVEHLLQSGVAGVLNITDDHAVKEMPIGTVSVIEWNLRLGIEREDHDFGLFARRIDRQRKHRKY
jgi:hypothetical protein